MTKKMKGYSQADWAENMDKPAQKRLKMLRCAIENAEAELKNAPQGRLRDIKHGKDYQYFWRKEKTDTSGTYLSKIADIKTINALAQKDYNMKFVKAANEELKALGKYLEIRQKETIEDVFNSMNEARRVQTSPFIIPDDIFIKEWEAKEYEPGYFEPGAREH